MANLFILLSKPMLTHSLNFMFAFRILLTAGLGSTKCFPIWEGHFNPQNGLADMKTTYLELLPALGWSFTNGTSGMGHGLDFYYSHVLFIEMKAVSKAYFSHILSIYWCYFPFVFHPVTFYWPAGSLSSCLPSQLLMLSYILQG